MVRRLLCNYFVIESIYIGLNDPAHNFLPNSHDYRPTFYYEDVRSIRLVRYSGSMDQREYTVLGG